MASAFGQAFQFLPGVKGPDGFILTQPFLDVCRQVLPVVDKLGTAFGLVKTDIGGNIERLSQRAAKDPERYTRLFTIVQDEVVENCQNDSSSCTKGLLWLKRAMEFVCAILRRLHDDPDTPLGTVVSETYSATLMQFHGFFASSAFSLAFKFVPSREQFLSKVGEGATVMIEMKLLVDSFSEVLAEIHKFMEEQGLNDPTKV
ncbi:hypothetical protein PLESTB_001472800 [Pleodorina starrii]|uniref:Glycolipid transfer protein domain-containing protein n=1 Tax=Pleodorina starrii TaxID=330485 RepID=A0A9W6F7M2_9CHLO|nr:hypothetical protein PLESTM_000644200 [Pleodorina starrii]GLC59309.1 hypothetical protein PLESTB_001472800 [Pleodorina starrii]GLC74492.1 hypothetical protein PLESTF_001518500 [Pleodorina starrii]